MRPGSYTHMTEFFGPLLAVMRFERLNEAVTLVNQTGYGLTSGLESLDEREWDYWKSHIRAGNLYINRVTTGAVVLRQPFGGMGKSGFGPGMKAGGPNYVAQFMDFEDVAGPPVDAIPLTQTLASLCSGLQARPQDGDARIVAAVLSYERNQREEFGAEHDHFRLVGQDNVRRYLPVGSVRVRVHANDTAFDVFARACAAHVAGCGVVISTPPGSNRRPSSGSRTSRSPGRAPSSSSRRRTRSSCRPCARSRWIGFVMRRRTGHRLKCSRPATLQTAASSACRCRPKVGWSCSGTYASRASAPTTTATATWGSGPMKSVPR